MIQCQLVFNYFDKCARCLSACRGAISPIRWKKKPHAQGGADRFHAHGGKTTINPSSLLARSHQPVRPSAQPNAHVAITHVHCSERQVQQNMILCIRSIFRRPPCAKRNNGCLHKLALAAAQDEADARVWTNGFFSFRRDGRTWRWRGRGLQGMTAGDGCPKSHQRSDVRQRWSETCRGWNKMGK